MATELTDAKLKEYFPNLTAGDYSKTSDPSDKYNCISWAAGFDNKWWEPAPECGYYWPENLPVDYSVGATVSVYAQLGFVQCGQNSDLEMGFEKVAIYGSDGECLHAARQLSTGRWTSKIGQHQDIEHASPESLVGEEYGSIYVILRRPVLGG